MASEKNLNAVFSDIANSIRSKKGTTGTIQPVNMASEIDSIEMSGGDIDALIDGSITEITSNATSIRPYFCYQCKNLTSVNLPNISTIPFYAFYQCELLENAIFSTNIKKIEHYAFYNCYKLTSYNFPEVTSIGSYAFVGYKDSSAVFPKVTNVDVYAFLGGYMTTANFPLLTSTMNSEFRGCRQLTTLNFPKLTQIGNNTFDGDTALITIDFPLVTRINGWAFNNCTNLATANFPMVTSIQGAAFQYCHALSTLILRSSQVATLSSTSALYDTVIAKSTTEGFIYVPDDLVESYKTATNWSTYASKIKGLSELGE